MDARGEYIAPNLSARQRDVFELIVRGLSNKEIARTLNLAEGTVKIHVAALFRKLGVQRRSAVAIAGGAISLPATGVPSSPGLPIHDGFSLESLILQNDGAASQTGSVKGRSHTLHEPPRPVERINRPGLITTHPGHGSAS